MGTVPKLVKLPIKVFGVHGRYATALYSAATKKNVLDHVDNDMQTLKKTMLTDVGFKRYVLDPTIKRVTKAAQLKETGKKMNLQEVTINFLMVMAEYGRLKVLMAAIRSFEIIMSAHKGEISCEVITTSF